MDEPTWPVTRGGVIVAAKEITNVPRRSAPCHGTDPNSAGRLASRAIVLRATPFAAFAVIASVMLPMPSALLVVGEAWIVNQSIGFGVLGYPHSTSTFLWGLAIGLAALLATVSAKTALRAWPRANSATALVSSILAAYASYEVVLLAFTPVLGGAGAFTLTIVIRLGLLNLLWLVGLVAVCVLLRGGTVLWQHRLAN